MREAILLHYPNTRLPSHQSAQHQMDSQPARNQGITGGFATIAEAATGLIISGIDLTRTVQREQVKLLIGRSNCASRAAMHCDIVR